MKRSSLFIAQWLISNLNGVIFVNWWNLVQENWRAIDLVYWPRAILITISSIINSFYARRENKIYDLEIIDVKTKPPIFILGHYRSGTTFLHSLMTMDRQFAYPNLYQVSYPHTFLSTEHMYSKVARFVLPETRQFDNVALSINMPMEDEYALCVQTFLSSMMGWTFPRRWDNCTPYLTFRSVPQEEILRWKAALDRFLKKLTWKYDRPLVLKSPPHTARIRLLLELFPDARFVHIHRNPYTVYHSTKRYEEIGTLPLRLQRVDPQQTHSRIIQRFKVMYDTFFEERKLIPDGQLCEVCFEDLEKDPVVQIEAIYETLNLPGFDSVRPVLQEYVDSLADYKKNEYPDLPESVRNDIWANWQQCFEEWGYAR